MQKVDFSKALGQIITRLRAGRNISQEELALEAKVDFTRVEEIERGESNPFTDTLSQIANVLGQKMGSLIIEAEELSSGVIKKTIPIVKPEYINRDVILPQGLTHDQLEYKPYLSISNLEFTDSIAEIVSNLVLERQRFKKLYPGRFCLADLHFLQFA